MKKISNPFPILLTILCALPGCALTSKAEATMPRYFSPNLPQGSIKNGTLHSAVELRLGRVTAGSYIREKIVYRESGFEIGFYDDRLWTEKPEVYLRRALNRVLFEEEGLRNMVSGPGPLLDVELLNFEEIRLPTHLALVRLTFSLRDDHAVLLRHTVTMERPIAAANKDRAADAIAEALGEALRLAVYEVSEDVLREVAVASASPTIPKR